MPARRSKYGHVTWDGRLVVDVNRLYRSKAVQDTLENISRKLGRKVESEPDKLRPQTDS
jgi:hypothetical protein